MATCGQPRLVKHILNLFSRCRLPYRKPCRWKRYNDSGTSGEGIFPDAFAGELPYRRQRNPRHRAIYSGRLSRYQINQQLLNALVEQDDAERLFRRFRAAGDLPYGAFGEIFWETQCQEMQQLADRVIACRQPGQSMEIDLACNGVQITGWLPQVQPDGLLRWRPSLLSVAQGMQLWLEHLVYCASGGNGESRFSYAKTASGVFRRLQPNSFALPLTTD